jgi:hypothetical protein
MDALDSKQKQRLLELTASGFKNYAEKYGDRRHVGALTDSEDKNRLRIFSCGAEFGAILDGRTKWLKALPLLRRDLFSLIERGCPLLDIIDFMFACTKGRSPAISDKLESLGLHEPSLHLLRVICQLLSEEISALNESGAGPLSFLPQLIPEFPEEYRGELTNDLYRLPELIGFFGDLLSIHPPSSVRNPALEAILQDCEIVFFYMLLDYFKFGFPTLSRLLGAMRFARSRAFPTAQYLRRLAPTEVNLSERSKSEERSNVRDPLSETALQKRLNLFRRDNGNWDFIMRFWILRYVSNEFSEHRASGTTFLSLLPHLANPNAELRPDRIN